MDCTSSLFALADVFGLLSDSEPLLIATLSRVCRSFNMRFGATICVIENLSCKGYFNDGNIKEIIATYGEPSQKLCKIYCSELHNLYVQIPNHAFFEEEYNDMISIFTASPRYRMDLIKSLTQTQRLGIYFLLEDINKIKKVSNYAIDLLKFYEVLEELYE